MADGVVRLNMRSSSGLCFEENKDFEENFKVYEHGIDLFGYPVAFEIWNTYLSKRESPYPYACLG